MKRGSGHRTHAGLNYMILFISYAGEDVVHTKVTAYTYSFTWNISAYPGFFQTDQNQDHYNEMPTYNPREMESGTLALLSRGLYISESCCAALFLVLGINSWYLSNYNDTPVYPQARLIYTEIIAGLAIPLANVLAWIYNVVRKFLALINLFVSLAFFSAFGALIEFDCDKNWNGWEGDVGESYRACWRATEAFCFIGAFFWLCSAFLAFFTPSAGAQTHLHLYQRKHSQTPGGQV
ncbi:hypothetical protein LTR46_008132 [Exophiala xenobiotica]|nr:hypothetical protein LTR46_008132 [Exophiala xenobiotica]